jgi:class 3 adenylate cyclase
VLALGQPRILNDLAAYVRDRHEPTATSVLVEEGYAASLTAPLRHGDRDLGFLFFNSRTAGAYHTEHAETIRRIAHAVAGVVAEIGVRGNTDEAWASVLGSSLTAIVRAARQAHEEEELLARVVDRVGRTTTLAQMLDAIYESFGALLPFDRIGFARVDPASRTASAVWTRSNARVRLGAGFEQPLHATSLPVVMEAGTPRILNDLEAYLARHPASPSTRLVVAEGMRSSITYFLGDPARPLGFLFFNSTQPGAYSLEHVARLRKITQRLSAAIERALLFDELREAHATTERLLHQLVPAPIARRVAAGEREVVDTIDATVVMLDLVGFSTWSTHLGAISLFRTMKSIFDRFDERARAHDVFRVRTMGDGYLAVAGVPTPRPDHAASAARFALDAMAVLREVKRPDGGPMLARIGLHSGSVVAGVGGDHDLQYEVWGPTVTYAARMESSSEPGRIQISPSTAAALGPGFDVERRGMVDLKGVGMLEAFWLLAADRGRGGAP